MKKITGVLILLFICVSTTSYAQTLQEMKAQYDSVSPLQQEGLKMKHTLEPDATALTPEQEAVAEVKAKEDADKKAADEKLYLDTDYRFFQSLNVTTLEEDALDKAYKQAQDGQHISDLKDADKTVKTELKTVAPQVKMMSVEEAKAADLRRDLILKKIAANVKTVKMCIRQNRSDKEEFKGTELTLAWEVDPSGKVVSAQVKATDVANKEIQNCILGALYEWDFNEIVKDQKKAAHVEYTYRFTNPAKKEIASQD
jgi:hypothetical protein